MDWKQRWSRMEPNRLARALGWFSIALGVAELAAPRTVARVSGMSPRDATLLRAYGAREVAAGVGLLRSMDPSPYLWARVAGDALDLATVGYRGWQRGSGRTRAMVALGVLAGVTAVDVLAARQLRRKQTENPVRDYSDRSGFPQPAGAMRGAARQAADDLKQMPRATVMPEGSDAPTTPPRDPGGQRAAASQGQASQGQAGQKQSPSIH